MWLKGDNMKKFMIIWANTTSVKYINYHFTLLGEILDYLDNLFPHEIEVMDADALNLDHGMILKELIKEKYEAIAFYVSSENVRETITLAEMIKAVFPKIKLVGYGPLTILIPKFFCSTPFNAIYSDGDYEIALASFFNLINGTIHESELQGLKLIKGGKLVDTIKGGLIDFKDLGFPRLDRIPIREYNKLNNDNKITLTLSRGCPFSCPHCLVQRCEGHIDRRRNLEKFEGYLDSIYPEYTNIKIYSPNFTLNKKYVMDFCRLVRDKYPNMRWDCATRVDLIDDEILLRTMHQSGCIQITLGLETLSPKELENIGKRYDLQKAKDTIRKIRSANIIVKSCVILGIDGQTKDSLKKTLDTLTDLDVVIRPMVYTPYHKLTCDMTIDQIESYNRKHLNTNEINLTSEQLVRLLYDIRDYRKIIHEK